MVRASLAKVAGNSIFERPCPEQLHHQDVSTIFASWSQVFLNCSEFGLLFFLRMELL